MGRGGPRRGAESGEVCWMGLVVWWTGRAVAWVCGGSLEVREGRMVRRGVLSGGDGKLGWGSCDCGCGGMRAGTHGCCEAG